MTPRCNRLLSALPEEEYEKITARMTLVSLDKGKTLFDIGEMPAHVYFPVGAIVSMMDYLSDGYCVETHMLGKNCMVGIGAVAQHSFYRAVVRSPGLAYRLPVAALMDAKTTCQNYVNRAQEAMSLTMRQLSQNIICGKKHTVERQVARWMLVTLDLSLSDEIHITHQELSELLGFRREAITKAMGQLADLNSIVLNRGVVSLQDRVILESESCDCYWIGKNQIRPKATKSNY